MCGRINVSDHEGLRALLGMMGMQVWPASPPRFNVPPTATLDTIMMPEGEQSFQLASMHWGYTVSPPGENRSTLFNARSETVFNKPSFRSSALTRRAIVPINGYYEWQRNGRQEARAFHITDTSEPVLALAAIYQIKRYSADAEKSEAKSRFSAKQLSLNLDIDDISDAPGSVQNSTPIKRRTPKYDVCVLTTAANQSMSHIHHRMPVILDSDQAMRWITQGNETLLNMYVSKENHATLNFRRVNKYVNNTANEGPECLHAPT